MDEDDPYMDHLDMFGELINSNNLSLDSWKHMIDTIPSSFSIWNMQHIVLIGYY